MIELVIGIAAGGLLSWFTTHLYYQKANAVVPEWAKPLIERYPITAPSVEELVELYHSALESGEIGMPDPIGGYVACPKCGASSDKFKPWEASDGDDVYRGLNCGKCGHEVSWTQV